jgi:hypothetical protein
MRAAQLLTAGVALALAIPAPIVGHETISLQRADGQSLRIRPYPAATGTCRGIAILSHGAGGSEEGLGYLMSRRRPPAGPRAAGDPAAYSIDPD